MEKFWIIAVITLGAFVSVDSLQCYSCDGCSASELNDSHLETCGVSITTTTPVDSSSTSSSTTTTPASSSSSSSTTTTPVDSSSTSSSTTTTPASSSSSSSTTTTPVDSSSTSSSTTTTPASSSSSSSTTTTPASSSSSSSTTTTTVAPPVDSGSDVNSPTQLQALRVRRSFQSETELKCTCYGVECDCDREASVLNASPYANDTYVCAKASLKDINGTTLVSRACSASHIGTQTICEFLAENFNATDCSTCTTDKCNGAHTIQLSVIGLLCVLTSLFIANQ